MITAIDLGLIFGLMALGVYLTFRVLDSADMTADVQKLRPKPVGSSR